MRTIRQTQLSDIPELIELFEIGRQTQLATGNPNQWVKGYPSELLLKEDIVSGGSYVMEENGQIIGTFYLLTGEDPTYATIYDGEWLDNKPYITIHRIAARYPKQNIGRECIEWIQARYSNIRIDTHELNRPMRNLIENMGFHYCGIIFLLNGHPRVAYQYRKVEGEKL